MPVHKNTDIMDLATTLDPKRIHDCKKVYPAVAVQHELASLNRKLHEKGMKFVLVEGTGKNGNKKKMDYCQALCKARKLLTSCVEDKEKECTKEITLAVEKSLATPPLRYSVPSFHKMTTVDRFFASSLKPSQMKSENRTRAVFGSLESVEVKTADEEVTLSLEERIESEMKWDHDIGELLKSFASPIIQGP